jgi:hypothetical protein
MSSTGLLPFDDEHGADDLFGYNHVQQHRLVGLKGD